MGEIITFEMLNQFVDMKMTNQELPKGWEKLVEKYIHMKRTAYAMKKEQYLEADEMLREAEKIARFLHERQEGD